jgi:hypothetical protein
MRRRDRRLERDKSTCRSQPAACAAWDDRAMLEYGNGVGQVSGRAGGGGSGGGTVDFGGQVGQAFSDAVHTVSALPPSTILLIVVLIVVGLVILRRAF